jgi:hypothetical protein
MTLLNTKKAHCRLALFCVISSSLLVVNSCAVTQCGVLQLQKAATPGITVSNNRCTDSDMALDSVIYLEADASIRLVSSPGGPDAAVHQILCWNQSPFPLKISVDSAASPWIRPEQELIRCNAWLNGRLECNDPRSDEKALICAISEQAKAIGLLKQTLPKTREPQPADADIDDVGMKMERQHIDDLMKRDITPQIDQCRKDNPSDQSDQILTFVWTITSNGKVIDTAIPGNINEDDFVKCAVEVIKKYPFPRFQNDIPVTYKFSSI